MATSLVSKYKALKKIEEGQKVHCLSDKLWCCKKHEIMLELRYYSKKCSGNTDISVCFGLGQEKYNHLLLKF